MFKGIAIFLFIFGYALHQSDAQVDVGFNWGSHGGGSGGSAGGGSGSLGGGGGVHGGGHSGIGIRGSVGGSFSDGGLFAWIRSILSRIMNLVTTLPKDIISIVMAIVRDVTTMNYHALRVPVRAIGSLGGFIWKSVTEGIIGVSHILVGIKNLNVEMITGVNSGVKRLLGFIVRVLASVNIFGVKTFYNIAMWIHQRIDQIASTICDLIVWIVTQVVNVASGVIKMFHLKDIMGLPVVKQIANLVVAIGTWNWDQISKTLTQLKTFVQNIIYEHKDFFVPIFKWLLNVIQAARNAWTTLKAGGNLEGIYVIIERLRQLLGPHIPKELHLHVLYNKLEGFLRHVVITYGIEKANKGGGYSGKGFSDLEVSSSANGQSGGSSKSSYSGGSGPFSLTELLDGHSQSSKYSKGNEATKKIRSSESSGSGSSKSSNGSGSSGGSSGSLGESISSGLLGGLLGGSHKSGGSSDKTGSSKSSNGGGSSGSALGGSNKSSGSSDKSGSSNSSGGSGSSGSLGGGISLGLGGSGKPNGLSGKSGSSKPSSGTGSSGSSNKSGPSKSSKESGSSESLGGSITSGLGGLLGGSHKSGGPSDNTGSSKPSGSALGGKDKSSGSSDKSGLSKSSSGSGSSGSLGGSISYSGLGGVLGGSHKSGGSSDKTGGGGGSSGKSGSGGASGGKGSLGVEGALGGSSGASGSIGVSLGGGGSSGEKFSKKSREKREIGYRIWPESKWNYFVYFV